MKTTQSAAEIEREAAQWVMRIDREGRDPALLAALDGWLAGDRRRRGALLQTEAVWALLDELGDAKLKRGAAWSDGRGGNEAGESGDPHSWLTRRGLFAGAGAAMAASALGLFFLARTGEEYATATGEIRQVPLTDGSVAAINTASLLEVNVTQEHRTVRLIKGEAWFKVAKDPTRPFTVSAGRARVEALGTAFSVRLYDNGADILVTEGIVEAWPNGTEGHRVRLIAGETAFVAEDAAIVRSSSGATNVDRALAWREGKIEFDGESLLEAVNNFNRYNYRKIIIVDHNIAGEKLYGIFRIDDPEGFSLAVQHALDVKADTTLPSEIRIGGSS